MYNYKFSRPLNSFSNSFDPSYDFATSGVAYSHFALEDENEMKPDQGARGRHREAETRMHNACCACKDRDPSMLIKSPINVSGFKIPADEYAVELLTR